MPGVIRHLSEKPETMTDVDFLKEDLYSSPKFALDPSKFSKRMQRLLAFISSILLSAVQRLLKSV